MDAKDINEDNRKNILALAERTKHYCDLLIKQCDSWLPEEEELQNLAKRRTKRSKIKSFLKKLAGC